MASAAPNTEIKAVSLWGEMFYTSGGVPLECSSVLDCNTSV